MMKSLSNLLMDLFSPAFVAVMALLILVAVVGAALLNALGGI